MPHEHKCKDIAMENDQGHLQHPFHLAGLISLMSCCHLDFAKEISNVGSESTGGLDCDQYKLHTVELNQRPCDWEFILYPLRVSVQ